MTQTERERLFWSKVDKKETHECWKWTAYINDAGYGQFFSKGKQGKAHRFAYESFYKREIPRDMSVLHLCDNPACCNPHHLFIGTQADNMKDMVTKERSSQSFELAKRMVFIKTKLSAKDIIKIRELKGKISGHKLAKIFKISSRPVYAIWNSKTYPCQEGHYV